MKQIKVSMASYKDYKIKIGLGSVALKELPAGLIITDENIAKNYSNLIGGNKFVAEAGEKSKSLENYERIFKRLNELEEQRIIAFGGGVVGDLAGFVAATYKRGIELIQIPTTLLAMVDSSIGGKNGLNFEGRKNYIGTIYQPKEVLIDPLFLQTLPEKEFKNGVAEIIKYSAAFNKPDIRSHKNKIEEVISDCCQIKAKVVEKDEFDEGYRHTLNLGHTIGHGLELLHNLSHGEAISIGMAKELELGERLGIVSKNKLKETKNLLLAYGLPTNLPNNFDLEKVLDVMRYDKKGKFIFAFNKSNYNVKVDEKEIREVLQ